MFKELKNKHTERKKKKVGKTEEHETANFCELPYCQHAGIRHIGSSEQWDLFLP